MLMKSVLMAGWVTFCIGVGAVVGVVFISGLRLIAWLKGGRHD